MIFLKKQFKFILFIIAFFIIAPLIVLYASGDTFANGWNILATGGIYVTHMPIGSSVYINGKLEGTTSFFNRSILIKGLHPKTYAVSVWKDGYNDWKENVNVSANLVFESDVFILQTKMALVDVPKYVSKIVGTTTVITKEKNLEYATVDALFTATTTTMTTQASGTIIVAKNKLGTQDYPVTSGNVTLWQENGHLFVGWLGDKDEEPQYMCTTMICQPMIEAVYLNTDARHFDFFPGYNDVILVASGNQVFAIQAENNPEKTKQLIYEGTNPDFLVLNGSIYIKDGTTINKVLF